MRQRTTLRDAVYAAYAAIGERDAAPPRQPIADGALDALLAPGARTVLTGDRLELLDLVGFLALELAADGAVLVICGSETPEVLALRWLHARARVPRSTPVSREGWQRLSIEAGAMAELPVSFSNAFPDPACANGLRAVLSLSDASPCDTAASAATIVEMSSRSTVPASSRGAWLERTDAAVRTLRVDPETEPAATRLYYECASGFFAHLESDSPTLGTAPS